MTGRKRSGSGSKRQFREKIVQIYESLFKGDTTIQNNPSFWDEFFLLKPNILHLEGEINKISPNQLPNVKDNINLLFVKCIEMLSTEHNIRIVYALQTLCALVYCMYKKSTAESGIEIGTLFMNYHVIDEKMHDLFNRINVLLSGTY